MRAQIAGGNSGLRGVPTQVDAQDAQLDKLIELADARFREGELHLEANQPMQAREKFDKAVETILASGVSVRSHAKLQRYYGELIERIYRLEVPSGATSGISTAVAQTPVAPQTPANDAAVVSSAQPGETLVAEVAKPDIPRIGFVEQRFEPSGRDELAQFELTQTEVASADTPAAVEDRVQIQTAVARGSLGFSFQVHPMIQQFVSYYQGRGRTTMETGLYRSGQFVPMARRIFREEGVPENIVWLGQVESAWKPWARSWAAASGLWQFIPGTGSRYGLRQTAYVDERNSLEKATRASARYLKFLANRYNGNWELAMAGYNCGEGNVDRAIARAGQANFWAAYPYLPRETRNYVPNILATILVANNPARYGFGNVRPAPKLVYDLVSVPTSTNLALIAQTTDTTVEVLRYLNPELRQNVTPNEPYVVRVPPGTANQMVAVLRRVPKGSRSAASITSVSVGEDWQSIANRTGFSIEQLQAMNSGFDPKRGGKIVVPNNNVSRTGIIRPRGNAPVMPSGLAKIRVGAGDTIAKIAAKYGFSATDLGSLNGIIAIDAPLTAGREIRIPNTKR